MIPTDPVPSSSGNAASRIEPQPPASNLALRRVAIDTWRENVAYLHRDCDVYRAEGFQALSKNGGIPLQRPLHNPLIFLQRTASGKCKMVTRLA